MSGIIDGITGKDSVFILFSSIQLSRSGHSSAEEIHCVEDFLT
jgi:hypothetical protein